MKKIFGLILAAAAMSTTFTACSDDENVGKYGSPSSVQILTADVLFEARASEGTITFTAPGEVTVRSSSPWCTTQIEGNTVHVSAETNDDLTNRTALLTLKCGADSANVTVIQQGVLFRFENDANAFAAPSNDAQTIKVAYSTNVETSVTANCDWLHPEFVSNDTLYIGVDANLTGHVRSGTFTYKAGGYVRDVEIVQYDFDANIAGNATVYYRESSSTNVYKSENTVITRDGFTLSGYNVPLVFDETTCSFNLCAGNKIGVYTSSNQSYDLYTVISDDVYVSWSSTVSLTGKVLWNDETSKTDISFVDNGTFTGRTAFGMSFYVFSGEPSSSTAQGTLMTFFNIRIER